MTPTPLHGRRLLVTGGTRGIGRAIAIAAGRAGAAVAVTYAHREADAAAAREAIAATGALVHVARADVADGAVVGGLLTEVAAALGGAPDLLVNNAAVTQDGLLMLLPERAWDHVLDTNLKGTYLTSKAVLRGMIAARRGRIVNVVSPAAFRGMEGAANYAAAKAGGVALTKSLAREVARYEITVNAVSPGFVDTQLVAGLDEARRRAYLEQIPLRRFASPEEISQAVLFLLSPAASYVTGTTLHVDGGLTML